MNAVIVILLAVILLSGCAMNQTQPSADVGGAVYSGEVWTWDERENIVTLLRGTEKIRVKITPEQTRTLRLHERAAVRGELAPPAPVAAVTLPAPPMTPIPTAPAAHAELTGSVASLDPRGVATIDSPQGRLVVWMDTQDPLALSPGSPVKVRMSVQPVQMVPVADPRAQAAEKGRDVAAFAPGEPGHHAVVTGRVLRIDPSGLLTLESPRGPVTIVAPDATRFREGMTVQVRTVVQKPS